MGGGLLCCCTCLTTSLIAAWSLHVSRADSLLHLCLTNGGSPAVLAVLLGGLPPIYPQSLRPNLQVISPMKPSCYVLVYP